MKIFSFSIKPSDHEAITMVAKLKLHCMRNGLSFSNIVIKALKAYNIEGLNKNVERKN